MTVDEFIALVRRFELRNLPFPVKLRCVLATNLTW